MFVLAYIALGVWFIKIGVNMIAVTITAVMQFMDNNE